MEKRINSIHFCLFYSSVLCWLFVWHFHIPSPAITLFKIKILNIVCSVLYRTDGCGLKLEIDDFKNRRNWPQDFSLCELWSRVSDFMGGGWLFWKLSGRIWQLLTAWP